MTNFDHTGLQPSFYQRPEYTSRDVYIRHAGLKLKLDRALIHVPVHMLWQVINNGAYLHA